MTPTLSTLFIPRSDVSWPSRADGGSRRLLLAAVAVFIAALAIRLYFTYPVHMSGDEFVKWYRIKLGLHGLGWGGLVDHHQLRWAMNIPSVVVQFLFGDRPAIYYIPSVMFGAASAVFAFLIGRLLGNYWVGLVAAILVSLDPRFARAASQFLPGIYSVTYVLGFTYFFLVYCLKPEKSRVYFGLSVLFMFLAYGATIPNLFILPGAMLFLYWRTRSARQVLMFLALLALLFFVETVLIALATGEFRLLGRVTYLGGHLDRDYDYDVSDLWERWTRLATYWRWLLAGAVAAGVAAWFNRDKDRWSGILLVFALLLSFSLCTTFAITGLDPLKFALPLEVRYLTVTIPLAILLVVVGAAAVTPLLPLVPAGFLLWTWYQDYETKELDKAWKPAVFEVNAYQDFISEQWKQGYALIFKNRKIAKLHRSVYLTEDILFKPDGTVEPVDLVPPALVNFTDTRMSRIYFISKTREPIGYVWPTAYLRLREKVTFDSPSGSAPVDASE